MRLSEVAIERPVLATVLSLLIVLFGAVGLTQLSNRELPDVDPPIVSVTTVLPGAAAEVVESSVTQPLEDALIGIEGIRHLTSTTPSGAPSKKLPVSACAASRRSTLLCNSGFPVQVRSRNAWRSDGGSSRAWWKSVRSFMASTDYVSFTEVQPVRTRGAGPAMVSEISSRVRCDQSPA